MALEYLRLICAIAGGTILGVSAAGWLLEQYRDWQWARWERWARIDLAARAAAWEQRRIARNAGTDGASLIAGPWHTKGGVK